MDDIQNDQEPSAQESDTDMEKTEVPAVPSKQNDDQQSNKLPLPFALNFSILMVSQPHGHAGQSHIFLAHTIEEAPRLPPTRCT